MLLVVMDVLYSLSILSYLYQDCTFSVPCLFLTVPYLYLAYTHTNKVSNSPAPDIHLVCF